MLVSKTIILIRVNGASTAYINTPPLKDTYHITVYFNLLSNHSPVESFANIVSIYGVDHRRSFEGDVLLEDYVAHYCDRFLWVVDNYILYRHPID